VGLHCCHVTSGRYRLWRQSFRPQKRLELLPPDLSKLYEKILQSLDGFCLEHAAQLFALVNASSSPLDLVSASFADEDDIASALRREVKIIPSDQINLRMDAMRRRINSRTKGLLEVKGGSFEVVPALTKTPRFQSLFERAGQESRNGVPNLRL
jgi:hypothetical protein